MKYVATNQQANITGYSLVMDVVVSSSEPVTAQNLSSARVAATAKSIKVVGMIAKLVDYRSAFNVE